MGRMGLLKLANIFYKMAQSLNILAPQLLSEQDKALFIKHIQQIITESEDLIDAVKISIDYNIIEEPALTYIEHIKNGAIRLSEIANQPEAPDQDELSKLYKNMVSNFNTLGDRYVDKDIEPMKLLKDRSEEHTSELQSR